MPESSRTRNILLNLALIVVSPIFLFLVLEAGTRLFWHQEVKESHVGIILNDPNRNVTYEDVTYETNSYGIRNREVEGKKPEGTKRILALGDSFTWGTGLPAHELVTAKIENLLQPEFPGLVVINTSVGSANTADEYQQLVRFTPVYDPDAVIVFFFTNDVLSTKMGVVSWQQRLKEFLRRKSKFFAFVYYQLKANYSGPKMFLPPDYSNLDDSKPGWVAFKQSLLQIREYCQEKDLGLLFVVIPTFTTLNENYPYAELREKVVDFSRSNEIRTLDLFDTFSPFSPVDLWVSPENTHWNAKGTTLAAERVLPELRPLLER